MKTAQEQVLEHLEKSSMTIRELRSLIPIHPDTVKSAVNKLKFVDAIHICGFEYDPKCWRDVPIYAIGAGHDALHPAERKTLNDNMALLSKAMFSSNYNPFIRETYAVSKA